jgi:hypothetical protein
MFAKLLKTINLYGKVIETKGNMQIVLLDHQDLYQVCYDGDIVESIMNLETKKEYRNV